LQTKNDAAIYRVNIQRSVLLLIMQCIIVV